MPQLLLDRRGVTIVFLETEPSEQQAFAKAFAGHTVRFATSTSAVGPDAEVVSGFIYSRIDAEFLQAHPSLRLVATRSSSVDHIDLAECARRGVIVSRIPGYGDSTVAEHTLTLMLALSRRLREVLDASRQSTFSYEAIRGAELRHKTLGIIGTGRIGMHVIPLAKAFGMNVVAEDMAPQPEAAEALGFKYVPLDTLFRQAHIISLHVPLTPRTWHLINADSLARCRRGVLIINTARGGLIDTNALLDALDCGMVGGAALDVLEEERVMRADAERIIANQIVEHMHKAIGINEPRMTDPSRLQELRMLMRNNTLLSRKNVLFTPHCAFNTVEAVQQINCTTAHNIRCFIEGRPVNTVTAGEM